jgi:hypothetical protein
MKPGDLVKLANYSPAPGVTWGVKVSWWDAQQEREEVVFDPGTPCVFLGSSPSPSGDYTVSSVLIRGRVGWVWPEELDPL